MAATTEDLLGRSVPAWCPGATGIAGAARLSGGASQETWSFDIVHPDGNIGAILRRAPPGYGAAPERAAGLDPHRRAKPERCVEQRVAPCGDEGGGCVRPGY